MALFKILKGQASNLGKESIRNGYCYVTLDNHKMYIDHVDTDNDGKEIPNSGTRFCLNAEVADRLSIPRTITLSGDASGSVNFDGSQDINLVVDIEELDNIKEAIEVLETKKPDLEEVNEQIQNLNNKFEEYLPLTAGSDKKISGPLGLTAEVMYGPDLPLEENSFEGQLFFLEDDGISLPGGGTAGQVLTKNSDKNGDAIWVDADSGVGKPGEAGGAEIFNNYATNKATGVYSHAEGANTTASGACSHAEGGATTASGNGSHAEGGNTIASGVQSHAEGGATTASGNSSHAEGGATTASGLCSHAEGENTLALDRSSHAEGIRTTAFGEFSHAEGFSSNMLPDTITGESTNDDIIAAWINTNFSLAKDRSHAEGSNTLALGISSHAEGIRTKASGNDSHAEGGFTAASGNDSHAEGFGTTAFGNGSHAEGAHTIAHGDCSHAEGEGTVANWQHQHVQGKYNIIDDEYNFAHIVGNGNDGSTLSNAHTLDWSGNAWYSGDIYVGSTSGTNRDEGSKKLATEEYVLAMINEILGGIENGSY